MDSINTLHEVADSLADLALRVNEAIVALIHCEGPPENPPPPCVETPPPPSDKLVFPPDPPAPKDIDTIALESLKNICR